MQLYYTVITGKFQPLTWSSSGWREQEYKYNYNVSILDFKLSP